MKLRNFFLDFFNNEKTGGIILICISMLSLGLANSNLGESYLSFWQKEIAGHSLTHWINEGLMSLFFLLIGLELKREFLVGELSNRKTALLPIVAALGGMLVPALIHLSLNRAQAGQSGFGIPMATDIAFAIGILGLAGKRVPFSMKLFLTALAVIDDLGAILIIAIFYTPSLDWIYLLATLIVLLSLIAINKFSINSLILYLIGGLLLWFCLSQSGVHSTISGVLLAFCLPLGNKAQKGFSAVRLESALHKPVAFFILPLFALANTALMIQGEFITNIKLNIPEGIFPNVLGIFLGLVVGKPLGIFGMSAICIWLGFCKLPTDLKLMHLFSAGLLGGIGFTMSIFISLLAFQNYEMVQASKIAIMLASACSAILGLFSFLFISRRPG